MVQGSGRQYFVAARGRVAQRLGGWPNLLLFTDWTTTNEGAPPYAIFVGWAYSTLNTKSSESPTSQAG